MVSLEQASRCPKCGQPGFNFSTEIVRRGQALLYVCQNDLCIWRGTSWVVQVRPDGTIPERTAGPKQFPTLSPGQEAAARRILEDITREERNTGPEGV